MFTAVAKGKAILEWNFGALNFPKQQQKKNWQISALAPKEWSNLSKK